MKDYIDRQEAIEVLAAMQGQCTSKAALIQNSKIWQQIKDLPSVDIEEVRHGKWIFETLDGVPGYRPTVMFCSKCRRVSIADYSYCPNCGARMSE